VHYVIVVIAFVFALAATLGPFFVIRVSPAASQPLVLHQRRADRNRPRRP
jgi:hypothetical protein